MDLGYERLELTLDRKECPQVVWHILEVIVNAMMVIEVSTRWVAYGKVSPNPVLAAPSPITELG